DDEHAADAVLAHEPPCGLDRVVGQEMQRRAWAQEADRLPDHPLIEYARGAFGAVEGTGVVLEPFVVHGALRDGRAVARAEGPPARARLSILRYGRGGARRAAVRGRATAPASIRARRRARSAASSTSNVGGRSRTSSPAARARSRVAASTRVPPHGTPAKSA